MNQYGFRPGHSTDHALVYVIDNLLQALDGKEYLVGVFMDLAKAFDTINHEILLRKLLQYGITETGLNWFKSYLSNREQQVKFNRILSGKKKIVCRVPQGSLLGPLLFILYINDLYKTSNALTFGLFADDANAFIKGRNLDSVINYLNSELTNVAEWFDPSQLSLNIRKTQYMVFSNMPLNTSKSVRIKGIKLEQVKCTKLLADI